LVLKCVPEHTTPFCLACAAARPRLGHRIENGAGQTKVRAIDPAGFGIPRDVDERIVLVFEDHRQVEAAHGVEGAEGLGELEVVDDDQVVW
jgi:hypothetical protein